MRKPLILQMRDVRVGIKTEEEQATNFSAFILVVVVILAWVLGFYFVCKSLSEEPKSNTKVVNSYLGIYELKHKGHIYLVNGDGDMILVE